MAGWHHWCNGHELRQTLRDGEGQGGLVYCSLCGHRVGHDWATEQQQQLSSTKSLGYHYQKTGISSTGDCDPFNFCLVILLLADVRETHF